MCPRAKVDLQNSSPLHRSVVASTRLTHLVDYEGSAEEALDELLDLVRDLALWHATSSESTRPFLDLILNDPSRIFAKDLFRDFESLLPEHRAARLHALAEHKNFWRGLRSAAMMVRVNRTFLSALLDLEHNLRTHKAGLPEQRLQRAFESSCPRSDDNLLIDLPARRGPIRFRAVFAELVDPHAQETWQSMLQSDAGATIARINDSNFCDGATRIRTLEWETLHPGESPVYVAPTSPLFTRGNRQQQAQLTRANRAIEEVAPLEAVGAGYYLTRNADDLHRASLRAFHHYSKGGRMTVRQLFNHGQLIALGTHNITATVFDERSSAVERDLDLIERNAEPLTRGYCGAQGLIHINMDEWNRIRNLERMIRRNILLDDKRALFTSAAMVVLGEVAAEYAYPNDFSDINAEHPLAARLRDASDGTPPIDLSI